MQIINEKVILMILTAWGAQLQSPEAYVIECFIVEDHAFICILN